MNPPLIFPHQTGFFGETASLVPPSGQSFPGPKPLGAGAAPETQWLMCVLTKTAGRRRKPTGDRAMATSASLDCRDERAPCVSSEREHWSAQVGGVTDQDLPCSRSDFYALPAVGA
jgi:hypothetical protein